MPRTGLPEAFDSWAEYQRHVDVLARAGVIEDGSKLWWDLRPATRFPTLEMRIADVCTTASHGATLAALFQSMLWMLWDLKCHNQRWRSYANMLVQENRWRAQRYGTDSGLIDFGIGGIVPFEDLLDELLHMLSPGARQLRCLDELLGARSILENGTSAHRQLETHQQALADGADSHEALQAVIDFLIAETIVV